MNEEKNLLYTKEHEWIKVDGDYGFVGITNHAQSELGDIIFVELPNVDDTFKMNDVFGTIEAVKTVADLYIPIDSEIVEINELLESEPEKINTDPYNDGWIVKVKLVNKNDLDDLLSFEEYQKLI
tara:strand:+ start:335 stop:709 length:375 start_codon:yes stop_codon:yes gene_type:complete